MTTMLHDWLGGTSVCVCRRCGKPKAPETKLLCDPRAEIDRLHAIVAVNDERLAALSDQKNAEIAQLKSEIDRLRGVITEQSREHDKDKAQYESMLGHWRESYETDTAECEHRVGEWRKDASRMMQERDTVKKLLSNLLARIHGDGGQYELEHGTEKAAWDAERVFLTLQRDYRMLGAVLNHWQEFGMDADKQREAAKAELARQGYELTELLESHNRSHEVAAELRDEVASLHALLDQALREVVRTTHSIPDHIMEAIKAKLGINTPEAE